MHIIARTMQNTVKRVTTAFVFMTIFGHVFCCVLPLIMSVSSLGVSLGLVAVNSPIIEWFALHEADIFIVAGLMITISGMAQYVSYKIDCRDTGCAHSSCEPKKSWSSIIFKFAAVLYVVNLCVFLVFPHVHTH